MHLHGLAAEGADERHLTARERVARPLRVAARRHKIAAAVVLEHVHRRRVDAAGFAAAHLQQHVVAQADAGAHQQPEDAVEQSFDDGGTLVFHGNSPRILSVVASAAVIRRCARPLDRSFHTTDSGRWRLPC